MTEPQFHPQFTHHSPPPGEHCVWYWPHDGPCSFGDVTLPLSGVRHVASEAQRDPSTVATAKAGMDYAVRRYGGPAYDAPGVLVPETPLWRIAASRLLYRALQHGHDLLDRIDGV